VRRLIEDYALLSDLQTAALVHRRGSIDWCCFPRFDSDASFAALLGHREHGRWLVAPEAPGEPRRRYHDGSLVLETEWETGEGRIRVTDFMPPRGGAPDIIRIVEGLSGRVAVRSELVIRFGYGRIVPWMRRVDTALVATAGPDALVLRTPAPTHGEGMTTVATFEVEAGERMPFALTWFPSHADLPAVVDPDEALRETREFWKEWSSRCSYEGPYREEVLHSLVVLKGLTYRPTGGIVAAPTTSLPASIGGVRNWDYRFCWLRDATLTLLAFLNAGYFEEAKEWRAWLLRAAAGDPDDIQIVYGVAGERRLPEWELAWLPGFEGSRPVRVGNAAAGQEQIDVYGEVTDALYQARKHNLPASLPAWEFGRYMFGLLERRWREPDEGIWEVRGERRHFTHSKVMAWVAFDRAIKLSSEFGREGPVERWRRIRDQIHAQVCTQGWNDELGSFTQSYGSSRLDASLLLLAQVGFLPAEDPRIRGTLEAVQAQLSSDGFLLRYRSEEAIDGLPAGEGAFLPCSFWLVDALALDRRHDEAAELFERLLSVRNDVGLLAEEYDPSARRLLGNFPQAFSHIALISSAFNLARAGEGRAREGSRGQPSASSSRPSVELAKARGPVATLADVEQVAAGSVALDEAERLEEEPGQSRGCEFAA
jgi:GH15 family glucan-1,4-alpha-glucosidase